MLERIRAAIETQLSHFGVSDASTMRETMLIRDGLFCGRKYQCQGFNVVWFLEENEVKFFAPDGTLLLASSPERCLSQVESAVPTRRAA